MTAAMQTDAWRYFKASEALLGDLQELLHQVSVYAAQGKPLPMDIVRRFDLYAGAFRQSFSQMHHSLQIAALISAPPAGGR